jgi:hypothetical protein
MKNDFNINLWTITASWKQEWSNIDVNSLIVYTPPDVEIRNIDEAYDSCENKTEIAKEMLASIGIKQ